jgi:hypothetical protein
MCFALIPEIAIKNYFKKPRFAPLWHKKWWKYVCASVGSLYILLLTISNLVGFGISNKGVDYYADRFFTLEGL